MAENNKLEEMIRTSLENLRSMVDANTVVGTPIETSAGTTIIPISKISVGYAGGGLDYDGKSATPPKNFAGGGGTGLSVQPVCLIAVSPTGETEVLPIGGKGQADGMEKISAIMEKVPEVFAKIKAALGKKKKKKETEEAVENVSRAAAEAAEAAVEEQKSAECAAEVAKEAAEEAESEA